MELSEKAKLKHAFQLDININSASPIDNFFCVQVAKLIHHIGNESQIADYTEGLKNNPIEFCESHRDEINEFIQRFAGMKLSYFIETLDINAMFDGEMFRCLYAIEDKKLRDAYLKKLRAKYNLVDRKKEFNIAYKHYGNHKSESDAFTNFTDQPVMLRCDGYQADDNGVSYYSIDGEFRPVCDHPILISKRIKNIITGDEKLELSFNRDGAWESKIYDCETLLNSRNISVLAQKGVLASSENYRELAKYFGYISSKINKSLIPVSKGVDIVGWIDDSTFLPYDEDIVFDGEDSFAPIFKCISAKGNFELWKQMISEYRESSVYVRLALGASYASPLVKILGANCFILDLWGESELGKTVAVMIALSVWGNPDKGKLLFNSDSSKVAPANILGFLNSLPFGFDDINGDKDPKTKMTDAKIISMTSGAGRSVANKYGGLRPSRSYANSMIFTNEEPITREISIKGAINRVIEVEVKELVVPNGNKASNFVRRNHGLSGKPYIDGIKKLGFEYLETEYHKLIDKLQSLGITDKQSSIGALIMLAHNLSGKIIFGDNSEMQTQDIVPYLRTKSDINTGERVKTWIMDWISSNSSHFMSSNDGVQGLVSSRVLGRHGKDNSIFVNKTELVKDMTRDNLNFDSAKRELVKMGFLLRGYGKHLTHNSVVNGVTSRYLKFKLECRPLTNNNN